MPDFDLSSYNDPTSNRLIAAASNDPQQSIALAQGRQQIQQNNVKLDNDQLDLARKKLQGLHDLAFAIGSDPTQVNAQTRIMEAVKAGTIDADMASTGFSQLMPLGENPDAIRRWAFDHGAQVGDYAQKLQAMGGAAPQLVDVGDKKVPVTAQSGLKPSINAAGGAPLQNGTTPEFDNSKTTWNTSDGVEHQGTNKQFRQAAGADGQAGGAPGGSAFADAAAGRPATPPPAPPPAAGAAPPVSAPVAAPASGQGASGRPATPPASVPSSAPSGPIPDSLYQTALRVSTHFENADPRTMSPQEQQAATMATNIVAQYQREQNTPKPAAAGQGGAPAFPAPASGGGAAPPSSQPPAPVQAPGAGQPAPQQAGIAGPRPGANQAATVDADASAKQFAGISAKAANLPNMKATVATMEAQLPQITTGPQAAAWNRVKSGVNFATELTTGKDAFDPKAIAAQDEFHNQSVKLAQQQFQQLGGTGTDGQLASASGDVPNESLSNMSNTQLLAMNKGLNDAQQAFTSAAQAWKEKNGPASYGAFIDDWNKTFSPRAFQFNYLSPAERGTMLKSMSPQEKAQLKSAYDTQVQRGWIAPQGAQK